MGTPVKKIIRDALNQFENAEFLWYIEIDEQDQQYLICDLSGEHFISCTKLPNSSHVLTYLHKYRQPAPEKAALAIEQFKAPAIINLNNPEAKTMTGIECCQVVLLSKIFTFTETKEHSDFYKPEYGLLQISEDEKELYLRFPLAHCRTTKQYNETLAYITKKMTAAEIKLIPPHLSLLPVVCSSGINKIELPIPDLAGRLLEEYLKHCQKAAIPIHCEHSALLSLADKIIQNHSMDSWFSTLIAEARQLELEVPQEQFSQKEADVILDKVIDNYEKTIDEEYRPLYRVRLQEWLSLQSITHPAAIEAKFLFNFLSRDTWRSEISIPIKNLVTTKKQGPLKHDKQSRFKVVTKKLTHTDQTQTSVRAHGLFKLCQHSTDNTRQRAHSI